MEKHPAVRNRANWLTVEVIRLLMKSYKYGNLGLSRISIIAAGGATKQINMIIPRSGNK